MAALILDGVTKRFGDFTAVDDLSFTVAEGEVFGFLGGNGAGKTTSLRMILDILRPDAGRIEVLGRPPGRMNAPMIGFLPEERGLYRQMTAVDTITYFGRLKGMARSDAHARALDLLDRFGLADKGRERVDRLSKGMAQKVQLATALVNRPKLLMLDEPFSGLDPVNQGLLEAEILRAAREGATVIFSTHVMQHAERLCDRLLLLARGRKRFEGTRDQAGAQLPARVALTARADPAVLPGVVEAKAVGVADQGWQPYEVSLAPGLAPEAVLEAATTSGFALRRFEVRRASLHDVFIHVVGGADIPASEQTS